MTAEPIAPPSGEVLMTVPEVAGLLRVSRMTVYRQIHDGTLPAVRMGRTLRVPRQAVKKILGDAWPD